MIFDTCEVLSEEMDRWVRNMIVPLCDGVCAVLFLFGSRLSPDVGERPGDRRGWRAEIGDQLWRRVRFDRDVHFTVDEVRQALNKLRRKVNDSEAIATRLHEITRGVPLAVRALLDLHEDDDDVLLHLLDISNSGEVREQSDHAVDVVVEIITNRLLLHLEGKPGRIGDMEAIVALALLPRADNELLSILWGKGIVKSRLSELTRRYALVADGDLHETVRRFLRQRWRAHDRPACFSGVLAKLTEAESKRAPRGQPGDQEYIDYVTMQLNVLSWSEGEKFLSKIAPVLAVTLAFDADPTDLLDLALEIREYSAASRSTQATLSRLREYRRLPWFSDPWGSDDALNWLEREAKQSDWGQIEQGSVALLLGLRKARRGHGPEALKNLTAANELLKEKLPRKGEAAESARIIAGTFLNNAQWLDAEAAIELQITLGDSDAETFNSFGRAKGYSGRLDQAERLFRRAAELNPQEPVYLRNLGWTMRLDRWEEARTVYDQALALRPDDAGTINSLALLHKERRPPDLIEAEGLFRRAAELDPKEPWYLRNLGDLLREDRRWEEARTVYDQALRKGPGTSRTSGICCGRTAAGRRPAPSTIRPWRCGRTTLERLTVWRCCTKSAARPTSSRPSGCSAERQSSTRKGPGTSATSGICYGRTAAGRRPAPSTIRPWHCGRTTLERLTVWRCCTKSAARPTSSRPSGCSAERQSSTRKGPCIAATSGIWYGRTAAGRRPAPSTIRPSERALVPPEPRGSAAGGPPLGGGPHRLRSGPGAAAGRRWND
jgi:tetratricopeptide (TPR) repeat protein